MSCGESLVSSITQPLTTRLATGSETLDRAGFSLPLRASSFPYDTVRILAEPFYNINMTAKRQIFRRFPHQKTLIAQARMQSPYRRHPHVLSMLGFSHGFGRSS
jgi:hypothetical protein